MRLPLDELRQLPTLPLRLPRPTHPRLQAVCDAIVAAPDDKTTAQGWADRLGVDVKTLHRLFLRETGMTFGQWRQQARLMEALERLATGAKVLDVALELGYASPSAFSTMFKRQFGIPPAHSSTRPDRLISTPRKPSFSSLRLIALRLRPYSACRNEEFPMPSAPGANRLPTFFIPHGGGPCFFMEWPGNPHMWDRMAAFLKGLAASIPTRPKAVLVVSGHWEEPVFTVNAGPHPPLLFDYYGFPEHTYRLEYPAPGSPELAARVQALLGAAGIESAADTLRGLDHGVFVPFKLIFPAADVPVVQLSMKTGLDPREHLAAGRALSPLREEGVLIVGSGMSFHNMRGFSPAFRPASERFDDWLADAVALPRAERERALESWDRAPDARLAQPRPDHLLPLMVAAGAAGDDPGRRIFRDEVMNVVVSASRFG